MGGCMGQWVGSGQMTNLIKLELINIIWFCLKIYNLSRHPYLWVDGWVNRWAHVKPLKSNKSWPNRDNSIMDILDILLDILLKPPQPFIGLFLQVCIGFVIAGWVQYWVCYCRLGTLLGCHCRLGTASGLKTARPRERWLSTWRMECCCESSCPNPTSEDTGTVLEFSTGNPTLVIPWCYIKDRKNVWCPLLKLFYTYCKMGGLAHSVEKIKSAAWQ